MQHLITPLSTTKQYNRSVYKFFLVPLKCNFSVSTCCFISHITFYSIQQIEVLMKHNKYREFIGQVNQPKSHHNCKSSYFLPQLILLTNFDPQNFFRIHTSQNWLIHPQDNINNNNRTCIN